MAEFATKRLSDILHQAGLIDRLGESMPGLVYVYDLVEQRNVFTNRQLAEVLGYSPEQVGRMGEQLLAEIIHPDDLSRIVEHHAEMAGSPDGQTVEVEYRVRAAASEWRWLHSWESVLTRNDEGRTRLFLGIAHDVTARVRAEEELRDSQRRLAESEQRWRSLVENPFDFVVIIDRDYKYTFVNFTAPGIEREALIGKATPFDFVSKADHQGMQEAFDKVFNEGCASSYEVHVPSLDKWYSSLCGPIREGEVVTHASVLTREITAERRMQEQARRAEQQVRSMELKLAQSAKLEALGQLAGGIAHDFNNLLTGIAGIADLLAERLEPTEVNLGDVTDLRQAVARGAGLTRQLLAFCRQQPITPVVIDLDALLEETVHMLRRVLGKNVEIELRKAPARAFVRGDRTQLEQVLLNLALNARDAMQTGGALRFSLAIVELGQDAHREHPDALAGPYVKLSVQDSGTGMDAATLARVFEPFFTTKPIGAGTGLGLALVHGIIQQNGGFVDARSTLGQGTTFELNLPSCEPAADPAEPTTRAARGGGETILLVEDDVLALRLLRKLLQRLGYKVEVEERGDLALQRIESGLKFDLLLTDVLLPGMDGHSLYQRARCLLPGLPAVLMSGYTAEVFGDRGSDEIGTPFLAKPFAHSELAEKIRAALDARASEAPETKY